MPRQARQTSSNSAARLPESFKACTDGWQLQEVDSFRLVSEDEFQDEHLSTPLRETYLHMVDEIDKELDDHGKTTNPFIDAYNLLLKDSVINNIVDFTNPALRNASFGATTAWEYRQFLAHRMILSQINLSLDYSFQYLIPFLAKEHGFQAMTAERFKQLLNCSRAFRSRGRSGADDDSWWQRKTFLRKISDDESSRKISHLILRNERGRQY